MSKLQSNKVLQSKHGSSETSVASMELMSGILFGRLLGDNK